MNSWKDGETRSVPGKPYILKYSGGVYSCTCMAWKTQSKPIQDRSCKHLRAAGVTQGTAGINVASQPKSNKIKKVKSKISTKSSFCPKFALANPFDDKIHDPSGWLVSEKLDGVRAYWDGHRFISRQGNIYQAPDWFKEKLPQGIKFPLDGELWIGRGQFQKTVSIVKQQVPTKEWELIKFVVFDCFYSNMKFVDRLNLLEEICDKCPQMYHSVLPHYVCKSLNELKEDLKKIENVGGEGLMLRNPNSLYEEGRTNNLLKVKSFVDEEAIVMGYLPGKGKHQGRVGGLKVRMNNGKEFVIGTGMSDKLREEPPAIGTIVTFKYTGLTDLGIPKFASFISERNYE